MFKVKMALASEIVKGVFVESNEKHHNLRHQSGFRRPLIRTIYHGDESISVLGPKIWDNIPEKLKEANSIDNFKKSVRKLITENSPCRLWRLYISGVGLL